MRVDVENGADFIQYYGNRYLRGRDGRIYWVVHPPQRGLRNIETIEFMVSMVAENNWERKVIPFTELQNTVYFGLPPLGVFAIKNELLHLSYLPSRDGGRGFDLNRIVKVSFNTLDMRKAGIQGFSLEDFHRLRAPERIRAILYPEYLAWDEAMEAFRPQGEEGLPVRLAVALDKNFGLFLSSQSEFPVLVYRNSVCGRAEEDEPVFHDPAARMVWETR
jgi:hypothetical protein